MIALVTGGASSGKSAFAESLALGLPGPCVYLATMRHGDAETESRIGRHRAARADKGFVTVELFGEGPASPPDMPDLPDAATVLVEDLGNLVLNSPDGFALGQLLSSARNVVYVGNEVGCDGVRYDGFTRGFIERLGALSCGIAATADLVVEVVAGLACVVKGELPWPC